MASVTNSKIEAISCGDFPRDVVRNAAPARLYEDALLYDQAQLTSSGAIAAKSGKKTGRSPKDKRIVDQPAVHQDVWWGDVNRPFSEDAFEAVRSRAIDFLDSCANLYVLDAFAGWDPETRIKVRIVCSRPYHALFMHNMLIRPTPQELEDFGQPDYVIYNAGQQKADLTVEGVNSETCVALNLARREMAVLGTEYAGEMKKGVFTVMNYLMPKQNILSMHCSANEGQSGDVSLFFGLSGTGKTTLSADPSRRLIGDDEHCWSDAGIFNIEGGCYAKCINLSAESEPQIYKAIRFGSILENTIQNPITHEVDFSDASITDNTRCSYPIEFIDNARIPCIGGHPSNIIFLTCDAYGVLPPVSKLTPEQAMFHFVNGYTAKVAGTEVGVREPTATFSACFGAAFLVWHPNMYARLLAEKMNAHRADAWLINTGWTGGQFGTGSRIKLRYTRSIIDAIHSGQLKHAPYTTDEVFGLSIPTACPGLPSEILNPRSVWQDKEVYDKTAKSLLIRFQQNYEQFG
jgi:phosphoenolpyruvate carboxykinase (ATP)